MDEPATLRLSILGGFALVIGTDPAPALPRKTRALLAWLALQRQRPASREAAGELLWPDRGPEQIRHSLRQTLAELRKQIPSRDIVLSRDSALVLADDIAIDAAPLLALTPDSPPSDMLAAARAHTGPLLAGFPPVSADFDDWLTLTRARLEHTVLETLSHLATRATESGDFAGALGFTERMFAIDNLREDTHRRLLEACAAAGRRAEALRHYATIVETLRRELNISPARETRELAQRLQREMDPPPEPDALPATLHARPVGLGPPIAVMPFRQLDGEPLATHLTDGLVADIVCQLAGLRELSVISHGSTLAMREPDLDPRAIGRLLNVRYVVRGTLRRAGDALRLTTELTDAGSGMVVWARSHDTSGNPSFADQDRIVSQIVNTLAPRVQELELRRIRGKRPESLTVYEKVVLARDLLSRIRRDSFDAARPLLDDVVAAEPQYGEAHALLAEWHAESMAQGWLAGRDQIVKQVDQLTERALELDNDNLRALISRAHRRALLQRDFPTAMSLYRHALDVSPSAADAWLFSSYTYSYQGRTDEALHRVGRAFELSPRDRKAHDFYNAFCVAHYTAGNFDEAVAWGSKALAEPTPKSSSYRWTIAAMIGSGREREARDLAREAMEKMPLLRVRYLIPASPFQDEARRETYAQQLLAAGFPM